MLENKYQQKEIQVRISNVFVFRKAFSSDLEIEMNNEKKSHSLDSPA